MFRRSLVLGAALAAIILSAGCFKRDPANVFPGSPYYDKRVAAFKITPSQAYDIALEAAKTDNRMQFLSRRPTVVVKRWYVFSMPQGTGASLQGYHVNGDTGEVKFVNDKKTVENKRG
jgi:hypothetical protein